MENLHANFRKMMQEIYSVRMRAAQGKEHISGAERISLQKDLPFIVNEMITRALGHSRGTPESIRLAIDMIPSNTLLRAPLPDITTVIVKSVPDGRAAARDELLRAGVSPLAADLAIRTINEGAAPGRRVMRGAMLVDAESGERLEVDSDRGVRVSRMDMDSHTNLALDDALSAPLRHNCHLREALVLSGKVLHSPGIVAELCWSDDPGYQAGYVASPIRGYVRFPLLKERGDRLGGRAFFYHRKGFNLEVVSHFLQCQPILFTSIGQIHPDEEFLHD